MSREECAARDCEAAISKKNDLIYVLNRKLGIAITTLSDHNLLSDYNRRLDNDLRTLAK